MRGLVERLHEEKGVEGWAFDPADPQRVLEIELWAGTLCLAQTRTGSERPDICTAEAVASRPGFRFDDDALTGIKTAAARGEVGDLHVRVRGSGRLQAQSPRRTLAMVRPASACANGSDELLAILERHAEQATTYADMGDGTAVGSRIGYLEAIWQSQSGLTWLVGWMIDDALSDRPVIIQDAASHAAGIALSRAPRADVGPDATAFVAVMQSDWEPDGDLPPQIVLADGSGRYIEAVHPAPLTNADAVLPLVRDTLRRGSGPHQAAMLALLKSSGDVHTSSTAADRVHVDEVAILPGFGAFVTGWALSTSRQAQQFFLDAGRRTFTADEPSGWRFMRNDLESHSPEVDRALRTAGFVALFRGPIDCATLDQLTLRVDWHDGASTRTHVAPEAVRVLGLTSRLEAIRRFYPAIESERFFPEFAYHAALSAQAQARHVRCYEGAAARASVLLAAPKQSADLFLMFDQAARHASSLPEGWGISVIADEGEHRSLTLPLFVQLQRATGRPCSLFFTAAGKPTSDVIENVASTLSSERIAWLASHLMLTATGWNDLAKETGSLGLLAIEDPAGTAPPAPGLDAFVADLARWQRLYSSAPPHIGGIKLPPQCEPIPIIPNAATALASGMPSHFTRKLNEAIGRAHG